MNSRRLLPIDVAPDDLDQPFWDGCVRGEFLVQQCADCERCYWPATCCPEHGGAPMRWTPASGRGVVHTFTVYHHPFDPSSVDRVPYVVAVIRLDEGPFFHSDVIDCNHADVFVGMPVEVVFEHVAPDVAIPHFRPVGGVSHPDPSAGG
jgi:uncharacterized OB-fold protein